MRLLLLLALPVAALAQGSLTPTGAPAQTMKSLDQMEPRSPLQDGILGIDHGTNGAFTIKNPGSYYLTGNLTVTSGDAITINSANVTLDLGGFTVSSSSAGSAGSGVTTAPGVFGITIRNGFIRGGVTSATNGFNGPGLRHGIETSTTHNVHVEDVTVQGLVGSGITIASGSGIIRSCEARLCGGVGLRANQVIDSQARQCGSTAIFAGTAPDAGNPSLPVADGIASNCYGESITGSPGVFASTATACVGKSDSGPGIEARAATACSGQSLSGPGLLAQNAITCIGTSTSGIGLKASQSAAHCTGSTQSGAFGLRVATDDTTPVLGTAEGCTGTAATGTGVGLSGGTVSNCTGTGHAGSGLYALEASNCHGLSRFGTRGLHAEYTATGCYGEITSPSDGGSSCGLLASSASNCRGVISGGAGDYADYVGLSADIAQNCYGNAMIGNGLRATTSALNCYGTSMFKDGIGLEVTAGTATSCGGASGTPFLGFGTALKSGIAVSCTTAGGTIDAPQKFLGTP
ncbi:MAG: hypothetical protein IPL39_25505 [Opitutaceae bacterium]|nr:hypothetical protein [Opitutaceae bacterium]